ncbi:MAG TPA: sensor domain-containing diguanylate cyclase [Amaricoccus sp.]|uniref:sensor domain-containing diguanylate cyclase n=1 Tax=Amaricoccus sp. TaxID=1872485 RepID=UPI002CEBD2AC|nr:sensor domain-containing diguanylate cyclase [Amaricoccus sp.]HMQ93027.1 sensor domain-containing diguanylate cyclase [Amaricoccus sp.]HMR53365.1 sensor domain-containing diguanylate cyclase [Amaricoccus sp.]HMR59782.1 sensor domain-containing diguanylate cyclase [Amaricoccus sp.]HMU00319.1 sensor domain-containing diguanylate cyclase [Amaricoccus sp.]
MSLDTDGEFERLNALRRYAILDTPPEGAFDRITALAAEMLEAPVAMVSLVDANRIWYKSVHGPAGLREIARGPTLCGAAIEEDGVYMVEQASADPRTQEHPLVTGPFGLEFYIGVPLKTHEGYVLGTLCCMDTRPRSADLRQRRYLETLAAIVMDEIELRRSAAQISRLSEALAAACSDLERRACFDPLTGVLARAAMLDRTGRLLERAVAGAKGAALLVVDVDRFKGINDTYGHGVGDRVLKEVASRMAGSCRGGDLLGRIGGEEFLAVFAEVTPEEALTIAERLREAVCRTPVPLPGGAPLEVTVSGGLRAVLPGDKPAPLGDSMAEADAALYAAKSGGRNRIVLSDGSQMPPPAA